MWIISRIYKIIKYIWICIIFIHQLVREIYIVTHIISISNYQENQLSYSFYVDRIIRESEQDYLLSKIYEYNDFNGKSVTICTCGICSETQIEGIKPICCLQKQEICINCLCEYINYHTRCRTSNYKCPFCREPHFLLRNQIN